MSVAVFAPEPDPRLEDALLMLGTEYKSVSEDDLEAPGAWRCLLVSLADQPARRMRLARPVAETGIPVILVVPPDRLMLLEQEGWATDFIVETADPLELRVRVARALGTGNDQDRVVFEDLLLDLATYQATVGGSPIDLTYMEYELLRYFVENRGRVWSREQILRNVWGYDYYGGARTVDVHVRRLRAKIGEERAHWITTVRSVGYRFG